MNILKVRTGELAVNTYILYNQNKNAVIIDCGVDFERVFSLLNEKGLKPLAVLLTHAHFDHSLTAKNFQNLGAKICVSKNDALKLERGDTLGVYFNIKEPCVKVDVIVKDEDELDFGDIRLKVISTPGHTDGSVCFLVEDCLFSGDTLFCLSIGRTDFPTGSFLDMKNSLKRLSRLEKNLKIYPGHGEETSLGFEIENNPYMNL